MGFSFRMDVVVVSVGMYSDTKKSEKLVRLYKTNFHQYDQVANTQDIRR